jgi:hypothetical protein
VPDGDTAQAVGVVVGHPGRAEHPAQGGADRRQQAGEQLLRALAARDQVGDGVFEGEQAVGVERTVRCVRSVRSALSALDEIVVHAPLRTAGS